MIFNEDCRTGASKIPPESVDLLICDPPFGINETQFHEHYNRDESLVVPGYVEAPRDYFEFTVQWLTQAKRVLKKDSSLYLVSGWTHLGKVLAALDRVGLTVKNHIIWKFNFGCATKRKFVSSHYHILYITQGKPVFNTHCRFGTQEKEAGRSLLYRDLEDVWVINREYAPGIVKNKNKLPNALVEKMIRYSSRPGDVVGDFFLGNFTTALVAKRLGRYVTGFEINPEAFIHFNKELEATAFGTDR